MRTRRSLGNDPSSTASAGGSTSSATAHAAAQRRGRRATTGSGGAAASRPARHVAMPDADDDAVDDEDMIVIDLSEDAAAGAGMAAETKVAAAEEGLGELVTREMKGKGRLDEMASFAAPPSPHPRRYQADLPPSSQASRTTSPTESHAAFAPDVPPHATVSPGQASAAARSNGHFHENSHAQADVVDGSADRSQAHATFAPYEDDLNGAAPHQTDVLRRPPAFELPDSSPLDRELDEGLDEDGDQAMSADDSNRTIHASDLLADDDDDALMLPARELAAVEEDGGAYHAEPEDALHETEETADQGCDEPEPVDPGSEESFDHQTRTRRNLLPMLLQADAGADDSLSISGNEKSSPRRHALLVPTAPGSAADEDPPVDIFGPTSQRSVAPGALGVKSSFRSIQLDVEPNPFHDPLAMPARTTRLGQHRKSHSLAGHERAATNVSRSTAGAADSSYVEADSFAARLRSATRPAKARDSLGMHSRVPRRTTTAASSSSGASSSGPRLPVVAHGQAQILLGRTDPCVCGFEVGGKRSTLAALNEDDEMADDSLLGTGAGKENSPASSAGRGSTGWEAHSRHCVALGDLRDQGWRIYRET